MSTVGNIAMTLNDWRKRLNPDGTVADIMEVLAQSNPILDDMTFQEGNLPTGNLTTVRASLPSVEVRYINKGVKGSKSTTKQITDTVALFEQRSKIDVRLANLQPDPEAFRRSEDVAFVEAFGQQVAHSTIYGNTAEDPDTFNGLDIRYRKLGVTDPAKPGYTTVDAGGTGAALTSLFFVDWGPRTCSGLFPRNGQAGLNMEDKGKVKQTDASGGEYDAWETLFTWDVGLMLRDYRSCGAVRNVDKSLLATGTAAQKLAFLKSVLTVKNRLRNPDKAIMYCSSDMYTAFQLFLMDKNNSYLTMNVLENGIPQLRFCGTKIVKLDVIGDSESQIV